MRIPTDPGLVHRALLYRSPEELVQAAAPVLREGVAEGDHVMLVSSRGVLDAVRAALTPEEAGGISFERSTDTYTSGAAVLTRFQRMLEGFARSGRRARVVTEQPLANLPGGQVAELCRCDAAFNAVSPAGDATVICAYDVRVASPDVTGMLRRSHPEVIEGGRCRPSPEYTEPSTILARELAGPPLPEPAGEVTVLPCPRDSTEAREFVAGAAGRLGLAEPELGRFVTAVNEIVTNATIHAVLDSVRVWSEHDEVQCEVRDYGFGLPDPLAGYRHPDPSWVSGRGLWLARQLTDLVEVRSGLDGSTFRLHATLPGGPAPGPDG